MSKKLAKIETEKMMAYPLNKTLGYDYDTYKCYHCDKDYLTQGVIEAESVFCPLHSDYEFCEGCDKTMPYKEMEETNNLFYCNDCHIPKCVECDEPLDDKEARWCSQSCYDDYMTDRSGDEYK
jgi:hypothetical protein